MRLRIEFDTDSRAFKDGGADGYVAEVRDTLLRLAGRNSVLMAKPGDKLKVYDSSGAKVGFAECSDLTRMQERVLCELLARRSHAAAELAARCREEWHRGNTVQPTEREACALKGISRQLRRANADVAQSREERFRLFGHY